MQSLSPPAKNANEASLAIPNGGKYVSRLSGVGIVDHHGVILVRGGNSLGSSRYCTWKTFTNGFKGIPISPQTAIAQGVVRLKSGNDTLTLLNQGVTAKTLPIRMGGDILGRTSAGFRCQCISHISHHQNAVGICCIINYSLFTHGEKTKRVKSPHIGMLKPPI